MEEKLYKVRNRSTSTVVYAVPELNVRREIQAGESFLVQQDELVKLSYKPGGRQLMEDYLWIEKADNLRTNLNLHTEREYEMTEADIVDLIKNGSLDLWLDTLDFAPSGVIDLLKNLSLQVPLEDTNKRRTLKDKTGFDVEAILRNMREQKRAEEALEKKPEIANENNTGERRVKDNNSTQAAPQRRVVDIKVKQS